MEASGSKDDHIQAGCSPEAKSRQTVRRDGFFGTASVYIVGLWSEVDLPGESKVKRVVARTCRRWAVGAVKTAYRAPGAMFNSVPLKRSLPVQTGQVTSPLVHHPMRHVAVTCNADLVTEDAGAGPSINCTAEDAAALECNSPVRMDYIALSANNRSLEGTVKACSNLEGDNRVSTGRSHTNDVFTVSTVEGRGYRLGLSLRQRQ